MTSKFVSIMERIGHDIKVVWSDVVKYLPAAEGLAAILFPVQSAPVIASVNLITQAVATVEQKFAAAGNPTGTGSEKLAQVLSLVSPTVIALLAQEGLQYNQTQVTNIVNAVVAVLNVSQTPATASN